MSLVAYPPSSSPLKPLVLKLEVKRTPEGNQGAATGKRDMDAKQAETSGRRRVAEVEKVS